MQTLIVSEPLTRSAEVGWGDSASAESCFLEEGFGGALGNVGFRVGEVLIYSFRSTESVSVLCPSPSCRQGQHEEGSCDVIMSISEDLNPL